MSTRPRPPTSFPHTPVSPFSTYLSLPPSTSLSLSLTPVSPFAIRRGARSRSVCTRVGVDRYRRKHVEFTHTREKKKRARASERAVRRAAVPGGRRYFFYVQRERECRERHAFDWPGGEGGGWTRGRAGDGIHGECWWKGARVGGGGGSPGGRGRVARVDHPLPSIFRGFFLRATALACLDERTRGGTSIIYNQTADKATIALL